MHLATYTTASAGKMIAHYERSIGERDHIDRDGEIYNLAPEFEGGPQARYRQLTKGLEVGPKTRPLADWVVTKPKTFDGDSRAFFKAVYKELASMVGEGSVVCSFVHDDEPRAQPHMHFCFVPVVETPVMTNDKSRPLFWSKKDEEKNPEHKAGTPKKDVKGTQRYARVPLVGEDGRPVIRRTASASKVFDRKAMREIHPRMEKALCEALGVERVGMEIDKDTIEGQLSAAGLDMKEWQAAKDAIDAQRAELEAVRERVAEAERQSMELNVQIADKRGDLAELDSAIEDETLRLEGLQREAGEVEGQIAEVESSQESVQESLRALWEGRGAGSQEGRLAGEVEGLRGRISELERENRADGERVRELELEMRGLERRAGSLGERLGRARELVERAVGRLREVPDTLSRWGQEMARRLGKGVYNPNSFDYVARAAREASRALGEQGPRRGPGRSRGFGR